jgi:DUF4097 and DUF4098 domain-containing protein YvlB
MNAQERTMTRHITPVLVAVLGALTGCVNADDSQSKGGDKADHAKSSGQETSHSVNESIRVSAGRKKEDASTVNGSIQVDANATVGGAETVNGKIELGEHATADELHTVNGSITLDSGASVAHGISAVNGKLTLHSGAEVGGGLSNVNGKILLESAHVGGLVKTISGDMDIGSNSHVDGGLLVEKGSTDVFWFFHWSSEDIPKIVIGPGAVVQGTLRFEREVHLFVNDTATIGPVSGATPVKFSGDKPPA